MAFSLLAFETQPFTTVEEEKILCPNKMHGTLGFGLFSDCLRLPSPGWFGLHESFLFETPPGSSGYRSHAFLTKRDATEWSLATYCPGTWRLGSLNDAEGFGFELSGSAVY